MPPGWSTPRSSATRKGPRLPSSWSARCAGSAPRGSPWTASSPTTAVRIGPMPGGASAAWPGSVIAAPVRITPRPTARPSAGSRPPSVSASTSRCSTAASNAWPGWTSSSGGTTSTDLTAPTKGSRPALASLSCRRRECHQCPGGSHLAVPVAARERNVDAALLVRSDGQGLVDGQRPDAEGHRGTREIETPHQRTLLAADAHGLIPVGAQPLGPLRQRHLVVLSQRLHVAHLEAGTLVGADHQADVLELTVGKHERVVEGRSVPDPGGALRDAVDECAAAGANGTVDRIRVDTELGTANVLDHADRRHGVVHATFVTIISESNLDSILEAALADASAPLLDLGRAQQDADSAHAVVFGGVNDQAPPSAADVEKAFASLQAQLPADELELAGLGAVEVICRCLEVGARICELAVEDERVELRGQVVVVTDCLGISPPTVAHTAQAGLGGEDRRGARPAAEGEESGHDGRPRQEQLPHGRRRQRLQEGVEGIHVDQALNVGTTE